MPELERCFKNSTVNSLLDYCCAHPMDADALTILADSFEDFGTHAGAALAAGCRALALHDLRARSSTLTITTDNTYSWFDGRDDKQRRVPAPDDLYNDWFGCLAAQEGYPFKNQSWAFFRTRRMATEAAIMAFTKLPIERRAYYLTPESVIRNFSHLRWEVAEDCLWRGMVKEWGAP